MRSPHLLFALIFWASAWSTQTAHAQPREGRFLSVQGGLAFTFPDGPPEEDTSGVGLLAQAEYIAAFTSWFGLRPYGALLLTWTDEQDAACRIAGISCEASTKAVLLGGKARLALPIPWVAPFVEFGAGASLGVLTTRTLDEDNEVRGAALHIPVAFGLALGRDHGVEVGFSTILHPTAGQSSGALMVGLTFPLN